MTTPLMQARELVLSFVGACMAPYVLPGNLDTDEYIIPVSGGADSTWLAIVMFTLFPHVKFRMVFTDTKAEDPEIPINLEKLEAFLGQRIERVMPELGLYELIEKWGGFIPSASKRWCTRQLKLVSFKGWIEQFSGKQKWMFVGIRADEDRIAFVIDECSTEMPFLELGIKRAQVFQGLAATIGIPKFYSRRTRSGCGPCMFQRRAELIGLLKEQPIEFHRGKAVEKVAESDLKRHAPALSLSVDTGVALNWLGLPKPEDGDLDGRAGKLSNENIFGDRGIFVAGEFFYDSAPGMPPFVWKQGIVSYSTTLAGLKKQIDARYAHLLATAEVNDMTPEDIRRSVKFAVYLVELPGTHFDPIGPKSKAYTWQSKGSYAQLEHIVTWAERALNAETMRQSALKKDRLPILSVQYEWAVGDEQSLKKTLEPIGQVAVSGWYQPAEPVDDGSFDERFVACPMCSV